MISITANKRIGIENSYPAMLLEQGIDAETINLFRNYILGNNGEMGKSLHAKPYIAKAFDADPGLNSIKVSFSVINYPTPQKNGSLAKKLYILARPNVEGTPCQVYNFNKEDHRNDVKLSPNFADEVCKKGNPFLVLSDYSINRNPPYLTRH